MLRFHITMLPIDKILYQINSMAQYVPFDSYINSKIVHLSNLLRNPMQLEYKIKDNMSEKLFENNMKINDMRLNIFQLKSEKTHLERELISMMEYNKRILSENVCLRDKIREQEYDNVKLFIPILKLFVYIFSDSNEY